MEIQFLSNLIAIRQYIRNAIEFHTVEKATSNELNSILLSLDRKIIDIIKDRSFKDLISHKDADKLNQDNNIKSGLHKK